MNGELPPLQRMFAYASEGWKPVRAGMGVIYFEKVSHEPPKPYPYHLTQMFDSDPAEAVKPFLRYEKG